MDIKENKWTKGTEQEKFAKTITEQTQDTIQDTITNYNSRCMCLEVVKAMKLNNHAI